MLTRKTQLPAAIGLSILMISGGCAYNPGNDYKRPYGSDNRTAEERIKQHAEDSENHILRVSRHGYLVKNSIVKDPILDRNIHDHLTITEVTHRYKNIFTNALKLSCQNTILIDSEIPTNKQTCESAAEAIIHELAENPESPSPDILALFRTQFLEYKRPLKLMVFFHGGLNRYQNTDERMQKQLAFIKMGAPFSTSKKPGPKLSPDWQYPIFVSWPSNPWGSYTEHAFRLREGRRPNDAVGNISSPVVLAEDIVNSVGEIPSNLYYQFTNDKDRFATATGIGLSSIWSEAFIQFNKLDCGNGLEANKKSEEFIVKQIDNIQINRSVYKRNSVPHYTKTALFTGLTPFRYAIGTLWNGTIAGNAWKVMKRRARNMFDPTGDSDSRLQHDFGEAYQDGIGSSLGSFFQSLFNLQQQLQGLDVQVTLIGHSMGAIAVNNLLGKYQAEWNKHKNVKNIVFMASAASTQETLAIIPDIMHANTETKFYNLTLNRVSEVAEFHFLGLGPSGSLLVSIDKYHDLPEHHLKRTFGSEVNIQSSLPAILWAFKDVEGDIVFKAFNDIEKLDKQMGDSDLIAQYHPKKHGDFGSLNYWLPDTWKIKGADDQTPKADEIIQCSAVTKELMDEHTTQPTPDDVLFYAPKSTLQQPARKQ